MKKSEQVSRKFLNTIDCSEYEILTDEGFVDLKNVSITETYDKWRVELENGLFLEGADTHIVFDDNYNELYLNELNINDLVITKFGPSKVVKIYDTLEKATMYDCEVDSLNHRFYTNDILSHNSMVMGNIAVRAVKQSLNVGICTVELAQEKYVKRIGSAMLDIPISHYEKFTDKQSLSLIKEKLAEYRKRNPECGNLIIKEYATGTVSSIDIENYFLKIQEQTGIKFDLIVVDYLNLIKPVKGDSTLYEKIKNIAQELRAIAMRNEWCIISATQVKSTDFNSDNLRIDSASESSGLVATVDSLFGLSGEPGGNLLKIKNIANRDGGNMESYKIFNKDKVHLKMVEYDGPDSEFWSDEEDPIIADHVRQSNPAIAQPIIQTEPHYVDTVTVIQPAMIPNTDFDNNVNLNNSTMESDPFASILENTNENSIENINTIDNVVNNNINDLYDDLLKE